MTRCHLAKYRMVQLLTLAQIYDASIQVSLQYIQRGDWSRPSDVIEQLQETLCLLRGLEKLHNGVAVTWPSSRRSVLKAPCSIPGWPWWPTISFWLRLWVWRVGIAHSVRRGLICNYPTELLPISVHSISVIRS